MIYGGVRYIEHKSRSDVFRLWVFADLHYLNRNSHVALFDQHIAEVKDDPASFAVFLGDMVDLIGYTDPRFDPDAITESVKVSDLGRLGHVGMSRVVERIRPIQGKTFGAGKGNHEKKYELHQQQEQLHGWFCTELDVPNLGYCSIFDVIFVRNPKTKKHGLIQDKCPYFGGRQPGIGATYDRYRLRIFTHHGAGWAQTPGGKLNRLIHFMDGFDADLYLCAHVHDLTAKKLVVVGADRYCKKATQQIKLGAITGTYLASYGEGESYAEQRGYRPVPLGPSIIEIRPGASDPHARLKATI